MGDFPGHAQIDAVLTRLRSELKKTVIEAASPRTPTGGDPPTTGGYGLTLPASDLPENWGAGRISSAIDQLCPILEAYRWASLDQGTQIEDAHLASTGFTAADVYGTVDTAEGENLRGCGYLLLEQESLGPAFDLETQGRDLVEQCMIRVFIRAPRGFGQGQAQLYAGLLSRVLGARPTANGGRGDCVIGLGASTDVLQFGWTPELGTIEEESGEFLGLVWEAQATRRYRTP